MPEGRVGPFLPISERDIGYFNDGFSEELDSFFSSSIACCDRCYHQFRHYWPDVPFRQTSFEVQSMPADWAVRESRLVDVYSPAEISTLSEMVQCPRCLEYGACEIWLSEHGFNGGEFEHEVDAVTRLGNETPFLLLEHPFARRALESIRSQQPLVKPTPAGLRLFRARRMTDIEQLGQSPTNLDTYGPPPARYVSEGRFNHAGAPMLYLASSAETAAAELGSPNVLCVVGELDLLRQITILDLVNIDEDGPNADLFKALARSSLLAAPLHVEGWLKRAYVFSRFLADCARASGFNAIRYGSTKQHAGSNLVILSPGPDIAALVALAGHQQLQTPQPDRRLLSATAATVRPRWS